MTRVKLMIFRVLLIAVTMLIIHSGYVFAGEDGYYFDGADRVASNWGVEAAIEVCNPQITENGSSSAWVMSAYPHEPEMYIQAGWAKDAGFAAPKYFYEYQGSTPDTFGQKFLGDADAARVYCVERDRNNWYCKIDGSTVCAVNAANLGLNYGTNIQILGETHNTDDQAPGTMSSPVSITQCKYKRTDGQWIEAVFKDPEDKATDLRTMENDINTIGVSEFKIWDTRY